MTPPTTASAPPATATEREILARLFGAGRAAHPSLALVAARFEAGALERAAWTAADDEDSREGALLAIERRGRGADLFLALSCDGGVPGAWDRLCTTTLPAVARGLSARGLAPAVADAEALDLPGHLIQAPEHARSATRLGGYRGSSSLSTFLAVAAYARWSTERRRRSLASIDRGAEDGARAIDVPAPSSLGTGPEHAETALRLAAELPRAWARLTEREALALLYKDRDGLPQASIARLLGVGAPRVSRLLDRAYERLREALEGPLGVGTARPDLDAAVLAAVVARFLATLPPSPRP